MHLEIFNQEQKNITPFLKFYKKKYYLVGDTAIALHLGHRRSIDFDLFTYEKVNTLAIKKRVLDSGFTSTIILSKQDQIHFIINNVKVTFFEYPFKIEATQSIVDSFVIPDLLTLAAMKAFALGGRGKWKDYVDLYFILKNHFTLKEICNKAKALFTDVFNPILFCKQLSYFDDINYSEEVEYMPNFEVDEKVIKDFLVENALEGF
jgi:hypothetical protein